IQTDRGADSVDLVRRDRDAVAGVAEEHSALHLSIPHGLGGPERVGRIVGRFGGMGPHILYSMAAAFEVLLDALFHLEAGVIGSDRDDHGFSRGVFDVGTGPHGEARAWHRSSAIAESTRGSLQR